MNHLFATSAAIALLAGVHPLADAQSLLRVTKPTVVILVDTPAEQRRHQEDGEYNEFAGDFAVYANRMAEALRGIPQVSIRWSYSSTVSFPGTSYKPVHRRKLETGWGYVFFKPGEQPVVIAGVAEDDQLVCTAVKLYKIKVEGYACGT